MKLIKSQSSEPFEVISWNLSAVYIKSEKKLTPKKSA